MSEWEEYKIGDIGNFSYGKMPKKDKLNSGSFPTFSGYKYQYTYPEFNCKKDDLIVVARGVGGTGDVKVVKEDCFLTNLSLKMDFDKKIVDNTFVYYYYAIETLRYLDSGSAQSQITINDLSDAFITLPKLEEQKAIAEVLSSLDDKIDLLHRQNKTLEELAQALFRQWFIEGENTEPYLVEELVDSVSIKHSFNKDKVVFLNTSDVYDGKVLHHEYSNVTGLPGQAKKSIQKDDILFTEIRPANKRFAYIDFEAEDYVVSTKLMVLRSKGVLDTSIIYLFLKLPDTLKYLQMLAESRSGTFPQIRFENLKNIEIFVPKNQKLLEKNTKIFKDIVMKSFSNHKTVKTLENMRDTLLPKLISGEVRVKYGDSKNG